jgi:hypothetical protein
MQSLFSQKILTDFMNPTQKPTWLKPGGFLVRLDYQYFYPEFSESYLNRN